MSKPKMLITGGEGDLALAIAKFYEREYELYLPSSKLMDVTNRQSVVSYVDSRKFDVLINNAGTIHPKTILQSDEELWERDVKVNLIGPYLVTKNVLVNNARAVVVNISSTAAFNSYPNWSSYCSSKAGLVTFTKCLANDGYQAYCLCPGAILTKFRNGLGLSNSNAMTVNEFIKFLDNVINRKYQKGDVVFFKKDELKVDSLL